MAKAKMTKGAIRSKFYAKTSREWRDWLKKNHTTSNEIWLIFYRPHTERQNISYEDSLKEAAEFGWKQTLIKRIDDDSYARKFIPIPGYSSEKPAEPEPVLESDFPEEPAALDSGDDNVISQPDEEFVAEIEKTGDENMIDAEIELSNNDDFPVSETEEDDLEDELFAEPEEDLIPEESEKYLTFESEFGEADEELEIPPEEPEDITEKGEFDPPDTDTTGFEEELEGEDNLVNEQQDTDREGIDLEFDDLPEKGKPESLNPEPDTFEESEEKLDTVKLRNSHKNINNR